MHCGLGLMNGKNKRVEMAQLSMKILLAKISYGVRYLRRYVPEGLAGGSVFPLGLDSNA